LTEALPPDGRLESSYDATAKEAEMSKPQRVLITIAVVGASLVPSASAMAAINHNETLVRDA
jgi:hypothetical protein